MAKKQGQPTKYKKSMDAFFEENLGKGYSKEASSGLAGINPDTMYEWIKVHPSFSEAIKRGEALSIAFFEGLLISKAQGRELIPPTYCKETGDQISGMNIHRSDTASIIFALKTRFHRVYGEKLDLKAEVSAKVQSITDLVDKHSKD